MFAEIMAGNLSINQRLALGAKSLKHDDMLTKSESLLGEFTVPISKQYKM